MWKKFPHLSEAKLKERVFFGPDFRKMIFNSNFKASISTSVNEAWMLFDKVMTKFLGNVKDPNYELIVANMIDKFRNLG